jgi:hypothetical protein
VLEEQHGALVTRVLSSVRIGEGRVLEDDHDALVTLVLSSGRRGGCGCWRTIMMHYSLEFVPL